MVTRRVKKKNKMTSNFEGDEYGHSCFEHPLLLTSSLYVHRLLTLALSALLFFALAAGACLTFGVRTKPSNNGGNLQCQ